MTLIDAGHGDSHTIQRTKTSLLLWLSWSHYDTAGARHFDLVRFQWSSGIYDWDNRSPSFEIMPRFGITQNVQAKLDPLHLLSD
jgi:hypothetical protein